MKLAIFKSLEYGNEFVTRYYDNDDDESSNYLRISEVLDVDFPMLPNVDINGAKAKAIDKKINEALAVLENLKQQKQELLAITDMSSE